MKCGLWSSTSSPSSWCRKETSLTLTVGQAPRGTAQSEAYVMRLVRDASPRRCPPGSPRRARPNVSSDSRNICTWDRSSCSLPQRTPHQSVSQGDCRQTSSDPGPHAAPEHWACCCKPLQATACLHEPAAGSAGTQDTCLLHSRLFPPPARHWHPGREQTRRWTAPTAHACSLAWAGPPQASHVAISLRGAGLSLQQGQLLATREVCPSLEPSSSEPVLPGNTPWGRGCVPVAEASLDRTLLMCH